MRVRRRWREDRGSIVNGGGSGFGESGWENGYRGTRPRLITPCPAWLTVYGAGELTPCELMPSI